MAIEARNSTRLDSGGELEFDRSHAAVTLPCGGGWRALSSAVLNGGLRTIAGRMHVVNYNVPPDYDGITPEPVALLRRFASSEGFDPESTVGLLTAADITATLHTATRSADGIVVDVIVTAGVSNARAAGADADFLGFYVTDAPPPGTINTIILTNATLSDAALVEAHALAIESKCAECADLGLACTKDAAQLAQGTGTDATVVIASAGGSSKDSLRVVRYAGKHTLFAELLGQATRDATRAALGACIARFHGGIGRYRLRRRMAHVVALLAGSRPCVPPSPDAPVPRSSPAVMGVGVLFVGLALGAPAPPLLLLPRASRVLLAAVAWDRWLGEPPLAVHPVVLVGTFITATVRAMPQRAFDSPGLGVLAGLALAVGAISASLATSWLVLVGASNVSTGLAAAAAAATVDGAGGSLPSFAWLHVASEGVRLAAWLLEVVLVKSTIGGHLLATVATQMARLLERRQLVQARNQLLWLCSRDPSKLPAEDLVGATIESVAENLSDGFVAPLLWYSLLGPLGALGYRVANTLDSRVGYHGKFEWFGKPSARLDDLLNLLPARLTALCLAAAASLVNLPQCDGARGLRTAWRDCGRCESPNAGWPMAAMAGLLGVQLEKPLQYRLGDPPSHPLTPQAIRVAVRVAQLAGVLATALAVAAIAMSTALLLPSV